MILFLGKSHGLSLVAWQYLQCDPKHIRTCLAKKKRKGRRPVQLRKEQILSFLKRKGKKGIIWMEEWNGTVVSKQALRNFDQP